MIAIMNNAFEELGRQNVLSSREKCTGSSILHRKSESADMNIQEQI